MKKIGLMTTCAAAAILGYQQPAQAVDFGDILRTVLTSVTDTNLPYSSSTVTSNLDSRRISLESQISAGVTTGQLTVDEAAELRNRLRDINNLQASYSADGTLSFGETRTLVNEMSDISHRLELYLTNSSVRSDATIINHRDWFRRFGGAPAANGVLPNAALRKAHIDALQAELRAKIEQGAIDGRLTWDEAKKLRAELRESEERSAREFADGRGMSYKEEMALRNSLDRLEDKINRNLNDRNRRVATNYRYNRHHRDRGNVNVQQSVLRRRIAHGVQTGRLSSDEARDLYNKEREINQLESQLRRSNRNLSWREERALLNKLDKLSGDIRKELRD